MLLTITKQGPLRRAVKDGQSQSCSLRKEQTLFVYDE